jgi:hypothetical protein
VTTTVLKREPKRVAVILPRNRLCQWHLKLVSELAGEYDVSVFVDDLTAPYPRSLPRWLAVEQVLFGSQILASPTSVDPTWRASPEMNASDVEHVINLSEQALDLPNCLEIRYDGSIDSSVLVDGLLARRSPILSVQSTGSREPLESRPAIKDKAVLTRGLQATHAQCISLIEQALSSKPRRVIQEPPGVPRPIGSLAKFAARMLVEKSFGAADRYLRHRHHWSVALGNCQTGFEAVPDDGERFYADPFLYKQDGRTFLFVEEYGYASKKGVISAVQLAGNKPVDRPLPVLERAFHLSYPFVFADNETIYMLPESSANSTLDLYRAVDFPWRWTLDRTLFEGVEMSDATLLRHGGLWWLFAATAKHGFGDHDQLSLFFSEHVHEPWRSHPQNPLKSDCRSARPGGRIIDTGTRLLRPAQDCETGYGSGLAWFEITTLTPSEFREVELIRWNAERDLGMDALHHFEQCDGLQAIDFARPIGRGILRKPFEMIRATNDRKLDLQNGTFLSKSQSADTSMATDAASSPLLTKSA